MRQLSILLYAVLLLLLSSCDKSDWTYQKSSQGIPFIRNSASAFFLPSNIVVYNKKDSTLISGKTSIIIKPEGPLEDVVYFVFEPYSNNLEALAQIDSRLLKLTLLKQKKEMTPTMSISGKNVIVSLNPNDSKDIIHLLSNHEDVGYALYSRNSIWRSIFFGDFSVIFNEGFTLKYLKYLKKTSKMDSIAKEAVKDNNNNPIPFLE